MGVGVRWRGVGLGGPSRGGGNRRTAGPAWAANGRFTFSSQLERLSPGSLFDPAPSFQFECPNPGSLSGPAPPSRPCAPSATRAPPSQPTRAPRPLHSWSAPPPGPSSTPRPLLSSSVPVAGGVVGKRWCSPPARPQSGAPAAQRRVPGAAFLEPGRGRSGSGCASAHLPTGRPHAAVSRGPHGNRSPGDRVCPDFTSLGHVGRGLKAFCAPLAAPGGGPTCSNSGLKKLGNVAGLLCCPLSF